MVILENIDIDIDIDKAILQNIDIDKISNRFKFGISNRASLIGYRNEGLLSKRPSALVVNVTDTKLNLPRIRLAATKN